MAEALAINTKNVLSLDEASRYMGMAPSSLYKLTMNRVIPHSKPNGKMCYFKRKDLEEWMMSNPVATTAQLADIASRYCLKSKSTK